ncbi:IS3 family transposase [Segniliparus rotundus]|uniref:IS3 family transposase n=1 Tax=Segniliparus rotundus TaxID=286802 RepID=UPI001FDFE190|nr:IS3 family transposase [Segniliparus rotundus]
MARADDNALMASFFSSMQVELLDRHEWADHHDLAQAVFEHIEAFHNPARRHSGIGYHSPARHETLPPAAASAAGGRISTCPGEREQTNSAFLEVFESARNDL